MRLLEPFDIPLEGINLVEASAGTGKTYNITSLYIRALIEQDISVGKILVVTYTEAATKELKDRLLERIRESITVLKMGEIEDASDQFLVDLLDHVDEKEKAVDKLEKAVRMFDEASVYTIHGFCYQALQEQAFESGAMYDADMIGDDSELVQEAVDDYWRRWVGEASSDPNKKLLLKFLTDQGIGPDSLASELGTYIGKLYLDILPEETPADEKIYNQLKRLRELYDEMQNSWSGEQETILTLFKADQLNGNRYGKRYLENWMLQMDDFLSAEVPPVKLFGKFEKFTDSYLSDSLTKSAVKKGMEAPKHPFFTLADEYGQLAQSIQDYQILFKKELLLHLRDEMYRKKDDLQVLSYDDLLLRLRNALMNPQRGEKLAIKLREKYPIAMVDEFQDTDPNQYDIFRKIYKGAQGRTLFMIGDPKQSIYSFRGADVFSYLQARKDAPENKRFKLNRNFRSTPQLLRGLNAFWGRHDNPFVFDGIQYQDISWGWKEEEYDVFTEYGSERPPIRFRRLTKSGQDQANKDKAKERVAEDTADEIYRLLEGGKRGKIKIGKKAVKARNIAVLVRSHRQADIMSKALQERGIKSVRHSEKSVFESDEAEQLQQFLKALAEPANESLIKTALSLPFTGFTAGGLLAIEEDDETWPELLDQFDRWHAMWLEQGFAAMFRSVLAELNIGQHIIKHEDGERRLTNLLHLGELLQEESQYHREGTRSLLHWLARKREDSSTTREEEQMRLESDEELVKIVTMHKSKGLQYSVVFCPFLWYGPRIQENGQPLVYHDTDDQEITYLDLKGKGDPDRAQKRYLTLREDLAESLRLAYVAMTRAEHCLYLTWEFANASEYSALCYLLQDSSTSMDLLEAKVGDGTSIDWSGDEIHFAIERLCEEYPALFTLEKSLESTEGGQLQLPGLDEELPQTSVRSFNRERPVNTSYQVSSFSSLSSWMKEEDPDLPDYDQFSDVISVESSPSATQEQDMFSFPKGPQPGTCIHHIFEEIEFSNYDDNEDIIEESLIRHGIDQQWSGTVSSMLQTVLQKPLLESPSALKLAALEQDVLIPEMEFYFKNSDIKTANLLSIIRGEQYKDHEQGGTGSGFLKGFIDLTFKFGDKYYLLDYKTNYLGDSYQDYQQKNLKHEMREASYDLQYHIYTIAIHRFLKKTVPQYSYETHFGGAFYLFLRGMNTTGREGIYFDRPDWSVIQKLNDYLSGGINE